MAALTREVGPAPVVDEALTAELAKMGAPTDAPGQDSAPAPKRKSRSGTSGAARARAAKAATGGSTTPPRPRPARSKKPDIAGGMGNLYAMAGVGIAYVPVGPTAVAGPHVGAPMARPVGMALVDNA